MHYPSPGQQKSFAALVGLLGSTAPELSAEEQIEGAAGPLGWPIEIFGRRLCNRFAIHPMEGWDGTTDGRPTSWTLRRWEHFGLSGAALIWGGEAFAVDPAGRANPNQLAFFDAEQAGEGLRALLASLRAGQARAPIAPGNSLVGLQLTHSGRHSRPLGPPRPLVGQHVPWLDQRTKVAPDAEVISDEDLRALQGRYVEAARLAQEVGFDFVDIKACHGYLVHELLGARRRPGPYGGDYEGRTRFLRETVAAVRSALPDLGVGVRLALGDSIPFAAKDDSGIGAPIETGGDLEDFSWGRSKSDPCEFDPSEPLRLIADLRSLGVTLFNASVGSPYTVPHLQRPATVPPFDGYLPPENPLRSLARQILVTREVKRALPDTTVVGTGYSYLQEWLPHLAQAEIRRGHIDFVGLGRMVLSYPEMPADILSGRPLDRKRICRTFSDCTNGPRSGLRSGCFPLDRTYRTSDHGEALTARKAVARKRADQDSA